MLASPPDLSGVATWLGNVDQALAARGSSMPVLPEGAVVLADRRADCVVVGIEAARNALHDLWITAALAPRDCTAFDAQVRAVCTALRDALVARGEYLQASDLMAGLPAAYA